MKNKRLIYLLIGFILIWLVVITSLLFVKKDNSEDSEVNNYVVSGYSTDLTKVVDKNKSSIVSIEQDGKVSTGFIYSKNKNTLYVVSCLHALNDENTVDVYLNNGEKLKGNVVNVNAQVDLALIECDCKFEVKPVSFGDSKLLNDGEFILVIGTNGSLKYDFSTAFGIVSSNYREVENKITYKDEAYDYNLAAVQLNGDFTNGYSGSPIFNMNGEVVGVIVMKDGGVTLATTVNEVKLVLEKMINESDYHRLDFGISGRFVNELENYEAVSLNVAVDVSNGYVVSGVRINSLAFNAGIVKGDIIESINDIEINDLDSLLNVMYSGETSYTFNIIRNNEKLALTGIVND